MKKVFTVLAITITSFTFAQTGLKYIKISQQIVDSKGDTLKSGMAVIRGEVLIQEYSVNADTIPVTVAVSAYKSINQRVNGNSCYAYGEAFNKNISLRIPRSEYQSGGFEGNIMNRVLAYYLVLYPGNVSIKTYP